MKPIAYDFHIHSCLSPCASDDMTPANIVGMGVVAGLDAIAITDHNSCLNCRAAMQVGEQYGITVIPGMELCTKEEVHVICLFYQLEDAEKFSTYIKETMLQVKNQPALFGNQLIYNELDELTGIEELLLISASRLGFTEVAEKMEEYHGVMIPAHLDKQSNSLIYQLGFVPEGSSFTCFELRDLSKLHELRKRYPYLQQCQVLSNSDAHQLCEINGPVNYLYAQTNRRDNILDQLRGSKWGER